MVAAGNLETHFAAALELRDPAERAAYLGRACGDDAPLRQRIEALLSAYDAGEFLESPAAELAETAFRSPISEQPGSTIGPYKLLEQIGEGGMGLVFMAEQSQPLRRRVALKIIKPGLDTRAVIARFEAERQALALMEHPNIARVYDAGATDTGRPYFVMELVRGAPITDYCRDRALDLRERLELFNEVCEAVQHAHQKGIIHRDLKPTNILVTQTDLKPVPKVIDFGVAKATTQPLTDRTLFTAFSQIIGTPLYMSPEQADLGNQDVDTRSDVYSLGVVLYELLTGTTPFDAERLRSVSHDEMRRIIREEEPPKPSTRATTVAAATTNVAPQRDIRQIAARAFKGDLDWIVMKALEKDRRRRYESPSALAADVQRYLERQPILARPLSFAGKIAKWSRRHRGLTRAAAAALVLTTIGLGIATVLINRERNTAVAAKNEALRARQQAVVERARAENNLDLALEAMDDLCTNFATERLWMEPRLQQVRQDFLKKALGFYERFAAQNEKDESTWPQVANVYIRMAEIHARLGEPVRHILAAWHYNAIIDNMQRRDPNDAEAAWQAAQLAYRAGALLRRDGDTHRALQAQTDAIHTLEGFGKPFELPNPSGTSKWERLLASAYLGLGVTLKSVRRFDDAERAFDRSHLIQRRLMELYPGDQQLVCETASNRCELAKLRHGQGSLDEAVRLITEAIALNEQALAALPDDPACRESLWIHHLVLGDVLTEQGHFAQADQSYQTSCKIVERLAKELPELVDHHRSVGEPTFSWACALYRRGDAAAAERQYRQCLELVEDNVLKLSLLPQDQIVRAMATAGLALALSETKSDEAAAARSAAHAELGELAMFFGDHFGVGDAARLASDLTFLFESVIAAQQARERGDFDAALRESARASEKLDFLRRRVKTSTSDSVVAQFAHAIQAAINRINDLADEAIAAGEAPSPSSSRE